MFERALASFLKWQDKKFASVAIRAMSVLRKSPYPIHPKHLYDENRNKGLFRLFFDGMVFLDVGSGTGSDCVEAVKANAKYVYGIEKNTESIRICVERMQLETPNYKIIQCNLEVAEIKIPDNSVDLINFSNVLEHLNNRVSVLTELCRILKPNGLIYISIPNADTPWKKWQRSCGLDSRDDEDHKIEYSKNSIKKELQGAGLVIASQLSPIVPSLPINGLMALSAAISPRFYRRCQRWKISFALRRPEHSIGWCFIAHKKNGEAQ